jgi:hypothetical protein
MNTWGLKQGLGRFADALQNGFYPVPEEIARDLDPETIKALRRQAAMQMGLGMVAAAEGGAPLGQGINQALQVAQQGMGQGLGQAYLAKRSQREDERLKLMDQRYSRREEIEDRRWDQSRLDRREDVGYRDRQATEAARRAGVDDSRQAAMLGISQAQLREQQSKEKEIEKFSVHLARLRMQGKKDTDPTVAGILARLEGLGINAYMPQEPYNPFGNFTTPGAGGQLPPLDGLYNPVP